MKYLVACEHVKVVVDAPNEIEAIHRHICNRFVKFKGTKRIVKDVRVYRADFDDLRVCTPPPVDLTHETPEEVQS